MVNMDQKAKFYKVYASLPLGLRDEIVVVVDDEPLTWKAARIEVDNDTKKGSEILEKLKKLGILP